MRINKGKISISEVQCYLDLVSSLYSMSSFFILSFFCWSDLIWITETHSKFYLHLRCQEHRRFFPILISARFKDQVECYAFVFVYQKGAHALIIVVVIVFTSLVFFFCRSLKLFIPVYLLYTCVCIFKHHLENANLYIEEVISSSSLSKYILNRVFSGIERLYRYIV